jgi:hypothetical protein
MQDLGAESECGAGGRSEGCAYAGEKEYLRHGIRLSMNFR